MVGELFDEFFVVEVVGFVFPVFAFPMEGFFGDVGAVNPDHEFDGGFKAEWGCAAVELEEHLVFDDGKDAGEGCAGGGLALDTKGFAELFGEPGFDGQRVEVGIETAEGFNGGVEGESFRFGTGEDGDDVGVGVVLAESDDVSLVGNRERSEGVEFHTTFFC